MLAGSLLVALAAATAAVLAALSNDVRRTGEPRPARLMAAVLLAFGWAYAIVVATATGGWRIRASPLLGVGMGVPIALVGAFRLVARGGRFARRCRPRHPDRSGASLLLTGVALAGRSGLALLVTGAFAGFAVVYARIESQVVERRPRPWQRRERPGAGR